MARRHYHCRLGEANKARKGERGDEGVILVLWALCLSMLATLMVGVIALGNLLQSADNAQNAADAAALAAVDYLAWIHPVGPMVVNRIPISLGDECQASVQSPISQCAHYGWLYGYYIYEADEWEAIGAPGGQVSGAQALSDASSAWTCAALRSSKHHPGQSYCTELNIPAGTWNGWLIKVTARQISVAITATQQAMSIQKNYGFTSYSGCNAPQDFLLADSSMGVSCIAYDAAGTVWVSVADPPIPSWYRSSAKLTSRPGAAKLSRAGRRGYARGVATERELQLTTVLVCGWAFDRRLHLTSHTTFSECRQHRPPHCQLRLITGRFKSLRAGPPNSSRALAPRNKPKPRSRGQQPSRPDESPRR